MLVKMPTTTFSIKALRLYKDGNTKQNRREATNFPPIRNIEPKALHSSLDSLSVYDF